MTGAGAWVAAGAAGGASVPRTVGAGVPGFDEPHAATSSASNEIVMRVFGIIASLWGEIRIAAHDRCQQFCDSEATLAR